MAIPYLTKFGIGPHGKQSISKLLQDADITFLKSDPYIVTTRPRGILSGQLVIQNGGATYIPPLGKQPIPLRLRLKEDVRSKNAIFSAYMDESILVLEDVMVWNDVYVLSQGFEERWKRMEEWNRGWQPDDTLQGVSIRFAEYVPLGSLVKPEERQLLEFVPLKKGRRLIWLPDETEQTASEVFAARREAGIGPDIFSLWRGTERVPGIALVRTLAISRQLRLYPADEMAVRCGWNKMFERWEILGLQKKEKTTPTTE
jgi:hypothetical protein